jgi:hypothetical protein
MRILLLAEQDNSNVGFETAQALRSVGHEVEIWKRKEHPFKYCREAPITQRPWCGLVEDFKPNVIHFYHASCQSRHFTFGEMDTIEFNGILPVVQHGGTPYRAKMGWWDAKLNSQFKALILARTADLMHHPHAKLYVSPIDVETLRPRLHSGPTIVGHFPNFPEVKGTAEIMPVLRDLNCEVRYSAERIEWREHIERVAACDIIVETLKPKLGDKRFGEGGVTGFEASALGCIVITNSFAPQHYKAAYGRTELRYANSVEELRARLDGLLSLDRNTLAAEQRRSRNWVVEKHSYEPTGRYLTRLYEEAV